MTDLISRADAIDAVRKCKVQDIRFGNVTSNMMLVQKEEVIVALLALPSADAVVVVRCKDCTYYETCNLSSSHWWKGGYTVDIEFCSFGERREE